MAVLANDLHVAHMSEGVGAPCLMTVKAVGADTFFAGALVYLDSSTGKAQVVPETGDRFYGICAKQVVATAADDRVDVYVGGIWLLPVVGAEEDDCGELICSDISAPTDNPADLVSFGDLTPATNDIAIGRAISLDFDQTDHLWVALFPVGELYRADTSAGDVEWL